MRMQSIGYVSKRRDPRHGGMRKTGVELFIQERGARSRRVLHDYPKNQIPKVAEKVTFQGRHFRVMEIRRDLLVRHGKKARRGVLLIVEDLDALSW